jgi:hypothetical protein
MRNEAARCLAFVASLIAHRRLMLMGNTGRNERSG